MDREYFTLEGAQDKVGKVIRADEAAGGYNVAIEWDLPRSKPLVDWFDKGEYERYLKEL